MRKLKPKVFWASVEGRRICDFIVSSEREIKDTLAPGERYVKVRVTAIGPQKVNNKRSGW